MQGLMQPWSMTLDTILTHAMTLHGDRAVVTQDLDGNVLVSDYARLYARARQVSAALVEFGIRPGDRVGSLMWNDLDHLAIWYGTMGIGAVLHTLNPRLGPERVGWIAAHGGDRLIVCGEDMTDILDEAAGALGGVERILVTGAESVENRLGAWRRRAWTASWKARVRRPHGAASTRTARRASATPQARRAIRRACSTATGRTCCMP